MIPIRRGLKPVGLMLFGLLLAFVILEFFFRTILPAAELPYVYFDPQGNVMRYDAKALASGMFTLGAQAHRGGRWRINNYGWNSAADYTPEKADRKLIAVIGDSYVAGFEVDVEKRFTELLQSRLGDNEYLVYSFGFFGAPLSQYLQMSRYIRSHFQPDILVINVVHNDLAESLRYAHGSPYFLMLRPENGAFVEVAPVPYRPNAWKRILKRSAVMRYFYENLRMFRFFLVPRQKRETENRYDANIDVREVLSQRDLVEQATHHLVKQFRRENPEAVILFMIDALRSNIYAGRPYTDSQLYWLNELLRDAAETNGCSFLDLGDAFTEEYGRNRKKFNPEYDGHWNEHGHRITAEALYKHLQTLESAK